MKTIRVVSRLAPLALVAVAMAASSAEASRTQTLIAAARAAIDELKHNDFDRVEARFDAKMSEALPKAKLSDTWKGISQQIGALGACKDAQTSELDGYFVVVLPCEAVNAAIDARFVYDADNKIAGMFFKPHVAPAG
jgi:hypothetical protein